VVNPLAKELKQFLPSKDILAKWQRIVNLMTKIVGVPAGLVTLLDSSQFEVLIASEHPQNPYHAGARYSLNAGRYCDAVIAQGLPFSVSNVSQDTAWNCSTDISLGMVSYLGLPLRWPDGRVFGTLCVLDNKEHRYCSEHQDLLAEFKAVIEDDLRKQAEAVSAHGRYPQEDEAVLRQFYEDSPIPYQSLDSDGRFIAVNQALLDALGYSREELIGRAFWDILPQQNTQLYEQQFSEFKKRGAISVDLPLLRKDHQFINVQLFGRVGRHPDGGFKQTHCVWLDITERVRAEQALRESEETARALLNTPSVFTLLMDKDGLILDANEPMAARFHKSRKAMIGLCLWDLLQPDVLKKRKAMILAAFETGENRRWEDFRAGAWFESCVEPVFDENGTVGKVAIVAYNITESRRAQEALEKSERKYRDLVDEAATIILRWDINGNVTFFNDYAQNFFGFSEAEIIGKNVVGTIVPETEFTGRDLAHLMQEICHDPAKFENNENENIKRNGDRVWIAWKNRPIFNQAGELIEIHSVGIDISARKRAEEALRKTQDELEARVEERTAELQAANLELKNEITRRQHARQALEQERRLFVSGPTVVFKWRAAEGWPVEYVSPNVLGQFGYQAEEFTSGKLMFADIVHPDDMPRIINEVNIHNKNAVPHFEQEYRLAHRNGEYLWLYDFTVVVRNDAGEITHYHGYVVNITLRKQAEQRLLAAEGELRGIFNSLQDVYYRADGQGSIVRVSPSVEQVFGYAPGEIIGKPTAIVWRYPEKRQEMLAAIQAGGGIVQNYEAQGVHKDGTYLWLSVNAHFTQDEHGSISGVEGTIRDVTKRKQAEENLQHQKALFEAVFRDVPDAMLIANVDREIVMVNPSMMRIFGYSQQELLGSKTEVLYESKEEFERQGRERFNLTAEEKLLPYVLTYRRKDGKVFAGETVGTGIRDDAGKTIGYIGVIRDITERKRIEAIEKGRSKVLELLALGAPIEEVLHELVINAEEADPQMLCSVLLLDDNRRHLHYGAAPSLPDYFKHVIDGMEIGPEAGSFGAAAHSGNLVVNEDVMTHPCWKGFRELAARTGIRACWSEPIIASVGHVLGTFTIFYRDSRTPTPGDLEFVRNSARLAGIAIERRHSEEQAVLHQSELAHMSRLNVMGEMATGIAHELNQPLTAIANYASTACKIIGSDNQKPDKIVSILDSVQVQAKRASEIIHRLRKFVKKQSLQKSSVALNHLVTDVVGFMEIETKNQNVDIQLDLQEGLPVVYVDAIHIEQVLLNLIRNSLEAMMSVEENTRVLTVRSRLNQDGVPLVEIADTGQGMDSSTLKRIFEPFVTSKGAKGLGMGLSISRSIIEAHGGRLWAESEPGKGARFYLTVPIRAD
jgi:PAS domain S-box-containing protein